MPEHRDEDDSLSAADAELFRRAVADTRPLHTDRVEPRMPRPSPRAHQRRADEAAVMDELLHEPDDGEGLDTGEELRFARPGLKLSVLRKLRRGRYSVQADFDLHGMSIRSAHEAVDWFLDDSLRRGLTCVRIIHGKGLRSPNSGPVLKPRVAAWLRRRREVLAYTSARPADGGTGAVYVLLGSR